MASTQIEGKQEVLWLHELMEPQAGLDTQDIKREWSSLHFPNRV